MWWAAPEVATAIVDAGVCDHLLLALSEHSGDAAAVVACFNALRDISVTCTLRCGDGCSSGERSRVCVAVCLAVRGDGCNYQPSTRS